MLLYSTGNKNLRIPFQEAIFNSLPLEEGLYMPMEIPRLDPLFLRQLPQYDLPEIAFEVAKTLLGNAIPQADLKNIVHEAINFPAPIRILDKGLAVLELFHGPSLAFKDFGARFMSRIMGYFLDPQEKMLDVLVATSGDTGGAVALGFLGVKGIRVTILYPKGKVSPIQELQLTTNGQNIRALEVDGSFDDCQALVKQAFRDPQLRDSLRLTSANSINIARLLPQTFYYFHAWAQILMQGIPKVAFVVPSGNFGNIAAGILAWKMGLPVHRFVAATNANDTVPRFLSSGIYKPKSAIPTFSNAMDVGDPSNWTRIMDLFDGDTSTLKQQFSAYAFSDAETREAIAHLYDQYAYVACPHTAIAWKAATEFRQKEPGDYAAVFLSTAHPCKFPDVIPQEILGTLPLPKQVIGLEAKKSHKISMKNDYRNFQQFLLENLEN